MTVTPLRSPKIFKLLSQEAGNFHLWDFPTICPAELWSLRKSFCLRSWIFTIDVIHWERLACFLLFIIITKNFNILLNHLVRKAMTKNHSCKSTLRKEIPGTRLVFRHCSLGRSHLTPPLDVRPDWIPKCLSYSGGASLCRGSGTLHHQWPESSPGGKVLFSCRDVSGPRPQAARSPT